MKNSVGVGAIVLIISGFICKIFGALFRLPLTNIFSIEGIGVFQMVMSLYSLTLVFVTGGVTTTLSKLVSSARAKGEKVKIGGYFFLAVGLSLSISIILGFLFMLFSGNIARAQGASSGQPSYLLFILLLPLGALIGVFRGVIQGYENMTPTAISQIIEQLVKFSFGLIFAVIFGRLGMKQGVFGAFLGITLSEIVAVIYLSFYMARKIHIPFKKSGNSSQFMHVLLPLTFGNVIIPATHAIDSLIIVSRLALAGTPSDISTALFGLQTGVVGAILNFPLIISLSVAMAILPKVSYLSESGQTQEERSTVSASFSMMWLIILPITFGLMAVAPALYPVLYPKAIGGYLSFAVELTFWGGLSVISSAIMQFYTALLQAKGFYNYSFLSILAGGVTKILLVFFLASQKTIGIYALPISNIALALTVAIFAVIKLYGLMKIEWFKFFTPIVASVAVYFVVRIIIEYFKLSNILLLLISVFVSVILYAVMVMPILYDYFKLYFKK